MAPEAIRDIQRDLLPEVVEAAVRTEPYRRLYRSSSPPEIHDPEDLRRLPFTDRSLLAEWPIEDRVATAPSQLVRWATSGTSGRPMETGMSPEEQGLDAALFARQTHALGISPARLVLAALDHARERTEMFLARQPATVLTPASADTMAERIRSLGRIVLVGWPSVL